MMWLMSAAPDPAPLVGREYELRFLAKLIERVRHAGAAIVVQGEPGIGKSALLERASRMAIAADLRILTTAGVQSDVQVAFSGLYRLLRPVLAQADDLPEHQRDAVFVAFGRKDAGVAPDLNLIALASLNLLGEVASRQPLLLIVDDIHWLDRASADVIAFIARRLDFEPTILLAAVRTGVPGSFDDGGLAQLILQRLDHASAANLLDAHAPGLDAELRRRVMADAAGNPLALVELPKALEGAGAQPRAWLPLTTRLERAFAARLSGLPTVTQGLLLVAALNDSDLLSETLAAAADVEPGVWDGGVGGGSDLDPAIAVHLVEVVDDRLRFMHPLIRSAVRQRASIRHRQVVHAALARVLVDDPDRRVWHRAAASAGPDEEVAAQLEAAAARAQRHGGIEAAATALERAASLSSDPARRAQRLLRAAEFAAEMGRPDAVTRLFRQLERLDLSLKQRARMAWIPDAFDDGVRDVGG